MAAGAAAHGRAPLRRFHGPAQGVARIKDGRPPPSLALGRGQDVDLSLVIRCFWREAERERVRSYG
jgi:hypothetical protein